MGFRARPRNDRQLSGAIEGTAGQQRGEKRRSIRIAIVEDDRSVRENLALLIDAAPGFTCAAACALAEEAWKQLPDAAPDVVLMDIHLPGKSGIECLARLRTVLPRTQVIMLTVEKPETGAPTQRGEATAERRAPVLGRSSVGSSPGILIILSPRPI